MPRKLRIPSYRLHSPSSLAVVTIDGHDHYLGEYGSAESRRLYGELIAKHLAGLRVATKREQRCVQEVAASEGEVPALAPGELTVGQVVLLFMKFALEHYRKNGELTDEYGCCKSASEPLLELYEVTPVSQFGPLALKAVRNAMIDRGWSRRYINKSVGRIRLMFRHAAEDELVTREQVTRLEILPLQKGYTEAVELPKRTVVAQSHIEAVRGFTNPQTRDLIDLALLTGARPGELTALTGRIIDRSGEIWEARLIDHKMSHKERDRVLAFGAKAQEILKRYLTDDPDARLFKISRATFSDNLRYACIRLKIPVFTGHWLRHNAATDVRKETGSLDDSQALLGHADSRTTEIYAHIEDTRVHEIARRRG